MKMRQIDLENIETRALLTATLFREGNEIKVTSYLLQIPVITGILICTLKADSDRFLFYQTSI
ncbi:hypothetical protein EAY15_16330 [Vibrio anguillarum]|nr:hypothetical protein CMV05_10510 [Vibrio anguillarum]MBF4252243.1 hypothetical protein [Vibrio anguillarum]MBF4387216.1 hypothetical protein [Vibrio anguillarum]MBF4404789.1 hypothetical protein [Vibrio anguillarum]OXX26567.1 hypothetical protein B9J92_06980 [Vibrio sp. V08_P9A1T1]